jgi:hypothetical protein
VRESAVKRALPSRDRRLPPGPGRHETLRPRKNPSRPDGSGQPESTFVDVYFSTVKRGAPSESGGELVRLDWRTKTVRARVPVVPTDPEVHDPNRRGNSRGGRGIVIQDGRVHVATYHSILVFDYELNPVGRIDNHLFVGLHELSSGGDHMWAASTAIDAAIAFDRSGRTLDSWWPRETPKLQALLKLVPRVIDKSADNRLAFLTKEHITGTHTHLNAATWHDGQLFALLNRHGMVYNATRDEVVVHRPEMRGAHNVTFSDGHLLVNDTQGRKVVVFDLRGRLVREIDLLAFPVVREAFARVRMQRIAAWLVARFSRTAHVPRPIFVRGLHRSGPGRVLVGYSPASILELDFERGTVVDSFQYSEDLRVCVHGLARAPE